MRLPVLYEDNHLLVVNKPSGWIVQGASPNDTSLIVEAAEYLRAKYQKPGKVYVGVVSRLDRVVTGVLPLARTSKAAARMSEQFRERSVEKVYWAVVTGEPSSTNPRLHHWLARDEKRAKTYRCDPSVPGAVEASLVFRILESWEHLHLIEIQLETGRKHQIRAQLEAVGCPVVGDRKYGSSMTWHDSIALHCRRISLVHPTLKSKFSWQAPLPNNWDKLAIPNCDEFDRDAVG
ncbi:MAG: RluA family pseudouridine synthase [Pirellulaceae bacterium]|nr:RluA family pseudouridine synthase [Pirellulaceae bacterium]